MESADESQTPKSTVLQNGSKQESPLASNSSKELRVSILPRPKTKEPMTTKAPKESPAETLEPDQSKVKLPSQQKTLEQRELEYAEARRRLLGDVRFLEEEKEAELESRLTPAEILKMKIDEAMQDNPGGGPNPS